MTGTGIGTGATAGMAIGPLDPRSLQPNTSEGVGRILSKVWNSKWHCIEPESTHFLLEVTEEAWGMEHMSFHDEPFSFPSLDSLQKKKNHKTKTSSIWRRKQENSQHFNIWARTT